MKERLLRDNELTLIKAVSICRAKEESQSRMKDLKQEQISAVKNKDTQTVKPSSGKTHTFQKSTGTGKQQTSGKQKYSCPNYQSRSTFTCGKCGKGHSQ